MIEAIKGKPGSIAVLDIGSSKVACFIGQLHDNNEIEILGVGHQLAKGIKAGLINDVGEAVESIVAAVDAAEHMAEERIEQVLVSINGTHLTSRSVSVELEIAAEGVSDQDIVDLMHEGCNSIAEDDLAQLHCFPLQYYVDDSKGLHDPRGMLGDVVGAELHILSAKQSVMTNMRQCLAKCQLDVAGFTVASHAAALSCLEKDERELGVTLIDMGGGVTTISVFLEGRNIFSDVIPIGGKHVTSDIAQGLSTTLQNAERIKTLHGSAIGSPKDDEVMIDVPQLGEEENDDEPTQMPRAALVGVIRPRIEELFEMVRGRLEEAGVDSVAGRRCVLTGGASQLLGAPEIAGKLLNKQVRKARPRAISGLPDAVSGPAFSVVSGLMLFPTEHTWEDALLSDAQSGGSIKQLKNKMMRWLRENF